MNPVIVTNLVTAALEIWRIHANKPLGWVPAQADWELLLERNRKTAEDYKREALANVDGGARPAESLGSVMATAAPGENTR